jgi:peptide/nickel transport system substrate-binding protein
MLVRRRGLRIAAGVAVLALAASACGSSKKSPTPPGSSGPTEATSGRLTGTPTTLNTATSLKQGGTLTYVLEKNITNWNINSSEGNTFETAEVMDGVEPQVFELSPDLSNVTLNTDMMVSAEQTSTTPQTIVYKIQPTAVWNDGQPISADDFIYFWKAQNGKDCKDCDLASTTGWDQIESVTGSDNGKTVTVVYAKPFGDWKSLFGASYGILPSHLVKDTPLADGWNKFFGGKVPTWSGGPYQISTWQDNTAATLVPNPKWYGKTKPHLDKVVMRVITDATQEPSALQNHEVDAIYPQPEVDLLNTINGIPNVKYQLDLGLTFEHFDFNMKNPFLQDAKVRQAMFTALNVQQIIDKTVGQFDKDVKQIGSRMLVPQQQGYADSVTSFGYGKGDIAAATKLLTDAGYKIVGGKLTTPAGKPFPTLRMRYTVGNAVRQVECELFKAAVLPLGINVSVESTDSLGGSLTHKDAQHDYDVIVFAWVANPFFASSNQPIYSTGGGSNYGEYSNKQVDSLLVAAAASSDRATQIKAVNDADKLISQDAYTLPLYQKPTFLAYTNTIGNLRDNATGVGPPYNIKDWGFRS